MRVGGLGVGVGWEEGGLGPESNLDINLSLIALA